MTDEQALVVVRNTTTPAEAKVLAALLQAEGIPAFVDGESLADEVAISRRVMNLNGVQVRVPANRLTAAREALAAATVDEAELCRQALEAAPDQAPSPAASERPAPARRRRSIAPILIIALGAAAWTFLLLWLGERRLHPPAAGHWGGSAGTSKHHAERTADGWRWVDEATGKVVVQSIDANHNGHDEEIRWFDAAGKVSEIARDRDDDGTADETEEVRADGSRVVWYRHDREITALSILDAAGNVVRRQVWSKEGFVDAK